MESVEPSAAAAAPLQAWLLTLEYDGSGFSGYQSQPSLRTVQDVLEAAVARLTGAARRSVACSRTDKGVHARGQRVLIRVPGDTDAGTLVAALNTRLPDDVAVVDAVAVPPDFHPQENVERKLYSYRVCHGRKPAIGRQYCWALPRALPPDAATLMRGAAAALLGRHDFTSLSDVTRGGGRAAAAAAAASATRGYVHGGAAAITAPAVSDDGGSVTFDNVRTLFAVEVVEESRDTLRVDMEASAFTRGMARNIVGLLVDVATGRCSSDSVPAMLAARCRASAGAGAPASGLCLEWIRYATAASTACGGGVSCDGDGGASRDGDGVASCEDGGGA